jgi:hypothetical protein
MVEFGTRLAVFLPGLARSVRRARTEVSDATGASTPARHRWWPFPPAPSSTVAQGAWTPTSVTGAPIARAGHVAVWTRSKMIVWGGAANRVYLKTGGV